MPVPSKMADLSTIASSNSPAGSEAIGNSLDDYLRSAFTIMRSTNAVSSSALASAATVDLGTADAEYVQITGTATITSFGTSVAGLVRECQFAGALTITASTNIVTPGGSDIAVAAGDVLRFRSMGAGVWRYAGASTAARLSTPRAFNLTGPVTATGVNFDGTGNVTLATAIADGALAIAKTSGLQAALDAKAPVVAPTFGGGAISITPGDANKLLTISTDDAVIFNYANGYVTGIFSWQFAGVTKMSVDRFGNLTTSGSVTATGGFQVSDRRSKHDIELRPVDISIAAQLAPLWSQWHRNSDNGFDTGLIAQDVLRIAPQFVQVPKEPEEMLAIDKAGIALECALSAELRINQLLARIAKLEKAR